MSQTAHYATEEMIDIIIGQEPYHRHGKIVGFPLQWTTFQKEDSTQPPRAFITICNQAWTPIVLALERDFVAVLLEILNQTIALVSIYSPPTEEADHTIIRIQQLMQSHRIAKMLLAGDYNAHSTTWGYADTTPKGRHFEDFFSSNNFVIHNQIDAPPTFDRLHSRGWPDLTVTSHQMANLIRDWTVVEGQSLSDHNYIRYSIASSTATNIIQRYNLPGRKVRTFTSIVSNRLTPFVNPIRHAVSRETLQNITKDILLTIQQVCDEHLPKRTTKRITALHWWNGTLRTQQQKCRALRRRLKQERRQQLKSTNTNDLPTRASVLQTHDLRCKN
ncbi:uncharacterized protein LOC118197600 [Stegodyphus dumicola]|uniref:uncharacterized protein LOC118197600 n=1 Tax=Stegodyphus dumicola TaxID=202533 RepID=UPI0015AE20CC|nr:uncharacterized protein LOC118197600 [Stegodyphus dumicola]